MSVQQKAGVVLPAACAVAASFDPALARSVGAAQGQAEVDPNIKRSPLCGRGCGRRAKCRGGAAAVLQPGHRRPGPPRR